MENDRQNQLDKVNEELSSIQNNPDTIQTEILADINTEVTEYTQEVNTEDLKTGKFSPFPGEYVSYFFHGPFFGSLMIYFRHQHNANEIKITQIQCIYLIFVSFMPSVAECFLGPGDVLRTSHEIPLILFFPLLLSKSYSCFSSSSFFSSINSWR